MSEQRIRPVARCVFRRDGRILVAECYDSVKRAAYYVPLGGAIEFGERGGETIVRELREELGAEVGDLRKLGALENHFICEGKPGHEVVLIYDGALRDESLYECESIHGNEPEAMIGPFLAVWKPIADFADGGPPLYPDGLFELLQSSQPDSRNDPPNL